jgi:serine/threonine protein kinase/predicted ATPase
MLEMRLGPYRLDRELGAGGMGKVFAARVEGRVPGLDVGAVVALKVVHPHLLETPGFFKRFLREAEIGESVVHENVVRTYDCDAVSVGGAPHHFLVMEYVEGQTLRGLLAELERVPEELCRHIGREVAKGLAAIHAAGVVHRDMKPENVLITKDHAVKVMDLGVARLADEQLRLSQSGAFIGSVEYAAPEQFGGKHLGPAADLHALGVILYELSCAQHPYRADDFRGVMRRVLDETPRRCAAINPQLSPFFEEVVHALLAKRPEDRVTSAAELARILDEGEASSWWRERAKAIRSTTKRPLRRIRVPRETALYGRDAELAKLRALYEKPKTGEGQVVLVEGEAGIGKSRLIDEFVGLLQREGEDVNFLFGSYPPGGAATASGAFSTAYREHFGGEHEQLTDVLGTYLPETPLLVPAFAALLRGDATPSGTEPLTKDSLQTVFVHATRSLAAERPTIVLIDDLHFAPEEGRALFVALALAIGGHRVLLVGTTRPGAEEAWRTAVDRAGGCRLPLSRLGIKDLSRLLVDTLKSERLAEELVAKVGVKSDGNPFFVFEILRGLREGQFITKRDDGTWVGTRVIAEIQIPSSVLDLVNARIASLSEEERDLLDVAACVGYEFDPSLVAAALGAPVLPTLKRFGQIERAHRLVRSAGRRCVFDHHQVQEALYGSLMEQIREHYHAAIASGLEAGVGAASKNPHELDGALCVDLAEHFLKGAQGARALRYLGSALTHLEAGYLNDAIVGLAERALEVESLIAGPERARLLLRLAVTFDRMGLFVREETVVCEARRLADEAGDDALQRQAARWTTISLRAMQRFKEAEALAREELELARSRADLHSQMSGLWSLSLAMEDQGRTAEMRDFAEQALALSRQIGDGAAEASLLVNVGWACFLQGERSVASELMARSLPLLRQFGKRSGEANSMGNLASVLQEDGRFAEAGEHLERSLTLTREIGDRPLEREILTKLGHMARLLGQPDRGKEHLLKSLAISHEIRDRFGDMFGYMGLAAIAEEEGDVSGSLAHAVHALELADALGTSRTGWTLVRIGDLRGRSGDVVGAREALERVLSSADGRSSSPERALAHALLTRLPGGDVGAAERAVAEAGDTPSVSTRLYLRLLLWNATSDRAHLVEAKRLLDFLVAHAPPECRESMLANVRVHREIVAACREQGIS